MTKKVDFIRPDDRKASLIATRNLKMARSPHAYVRGNTIKFYEWLKAQKNGSLPEGPPVWICGDCHTGNLGPVANSAGRIEIQIRDLDQTVIGNPAHDLIRLGLSLASTARGSDLPGVTTAKMLEQMMAGYEKSFERGFNEEDDIDEPRRSNSSLTSGLGILGDVSEGADRRCSTHSPARTASLAPIKERDTRS